jgi:hypothetical protein
VVGSLQHRQLLPCGGPPPATVRGLRGQADAVAEELEGWARVPVQPLLSVYSLLSSVPLRTSDGLCVAAIA